MHLSPLSHRTPAFWEEVARSRDRNPIERLGRKGVFLRRHDDVGRALRDKKVTAAWPFRAASMVFGDTLLTSEGEKAKRQRALLSKSLNGKALKEHFPVLIEKVLREVFGELASSEKIDLINEFAFVIPYRVMFEVLGLDHQEIASMRPRMDALTDYVNGVRDVLADALDAKEELGQWFSSATFASGSLGEAICASEKDPRDQLALFLLTLAAGTETTACTLANASLLVFDGTIKEDANPAACAAELVRYEPPLSSLVRFAQEDFEIQGHSIQRGEAIHLDLCSALSDPSVFSDPGTFDPGRSEQLRLPFGLGPHSCVGRLLALLEIELAMPWIHRLAASFDLEDFSPIEGVLFRRPTILTLKKIDAERNTDAQNIP